MSKQEKIKDFLDMSSITKTVLLDNEKKTNRLIVMVQVAACVVMLAHIIMRLFITPEGYNITVSLILGIVLAINIVTIVIVEKTKYKKATKYVLIGLMIFTAIALKLYLGTFYNLWVVLPIVLASTYNNKKIVLGSSIITIVLFYVADIGNILAYEFDDFNIIVFSKGQEISLLTGLGRYYLRNNLEIAGTLKNYFTIFVPASLFILIVLAFGCYIFAKRNYENIMLQAKTMEEKMRADEELSLAKQVQKTMLPLNLDRVIDECENIDVYGLMLSVEEISSDIYDFFMIGENKLCLFIGETPKRDVKSTLFMDKAKDLIWKFANKGLGISEILTNVNNELCKINSASLFITAWIGILDIMTGQMKYSSAGQNQQYKSTNGTFELISRVKNDVLLGAIENIEYEELEVNFEKGDKLFLYTDGVITGANNSKGFFGSERLVNCINKNIDMSAKELLCDVQKEIIEFTKDGEQSDDITMLCVGYK